MISFRVFTRRVMVLKVIMETDGDDDSDQYERRKAQE